MISDPVAVLVVLATVVYVAIRLEERFALFRSLGAALVAILLGMLLSNTGLVPGDSPTYTFLASTGVSLAVALILLSVDVRSVAQAGPRMLAAFAIGAVSTAIGAMVGALTLAHVVGPETWKLAGQFTGTYTGGGINFAALGRALDTSSDMFSAGVAADVALTAVWMATCLAVPVLLGRPRGAEGSRDIEASAATAAEGGGPEGAEATLEQALHSSIRPIPIRDVAALVAVCVGAVWLAGRVASWIPSIHPIGWSKC